MFVKPINKRPHAESQRPQRKIEPNKLCVRFFIAFLWIVGLLLGVCGAFVLGDGANRGGVFWCVSVVHHLGFFFINDFWPPGARNVLTRLLGSVTMEPNLNNQRICRNPGL